MEISLAYDSTKPWGDMLYEEEQTRKLALLRMPQAEWLACINAYFTRLRGNGRALISALAWAQRVSEERAEFQSPRPTMRVEPTEDELNWRVWKDMVEEPYKYGSDIGEWIALDEEVRRGPKRWRVAAFWYRKVREIEEARSAAVTKIQALWRGHVARTVLGERLNCGRCLAHAACPHWVGDDDRWVCRTCKTELDAEWTALGDALEAEEEEEYRQWVEEFEAREAEDREQGLEGEVCADCDDEIVMYGAKIGAFWFCGSCIHDWTACDRCDNAVRLGTRCGNHCRDCGEDMTDSTRTDGFCCGDCATDFYRDGCRWI